MDQIRKLTVAVALGFGLLVLPAGALADTTVQNTNNSENAYAQSGDAEATNNAEVHSGPQAESGFGDANAQQIGDNESSVKQESNAQSGDAMAGSQSTGVSGGHGNTTVQNTNNSTNPTAISGNATATNSAFVSGGPVASSLFGNASANQIGGNEVELDQVASALTGDAVAGSQVTGII